MSAPAKPLREVIAEDADALWAEAANRTRQIAWVALGLSFVALCISGSGWKHVFNGQQQVVYATWVSFCGVLIGFAFTAGAMIASNIDRGRVAPFRRTRGWGDVCRAFVLTLVWFSANAMVSFVGIICDNDDDPSRWVIAGLVLTGVMGANYLAQLVTRTRQVIMMAGAPV